MNRTGMTIYRISTFRGRNSSRPQLPREGGMHGTPYVSGRAEAVISEFILLRLRSDPAGRPRCHVKGKSFPFSGQDSRERETAQKRITIQERARGGADEGRTDGGNNNGRFRSLSVRWMDRGSCQAIIDERRETWRRPTVCRTVGVEGNGAAVSNSTERHTVAIHNPEGGSWRNAAGVPTCSALTDEGERSPFLHASCEKYPTVERIDSRGQYF